MSREQRCCWRTLAAGVLLAAAATATFCLDVPALVSDLVQRATALYDSSPLAVASMATGMLTVWVIAFLPTTIPELAIGFVFGLQTGYCVDIIGKYLGSSVSYLLGRNALRSCVQSVLEGGLLDAFEEEAKTRPFVASFLIRAAYLPMPVKNYGQAVLGIPPRAFFASMIPIEVLDTYLFVAVGAEASDIASLLRGGSSTQADDEDTARAWLHLGLLAVAICATGLLMAAIGHVAMKALQARRLRRQQAAASVEVEQRRPLQTNGSSSATEEEASMAASSLLL